MKDLTTKSDSHHTEPRSSRDKEWNADKSGRVMDSCASERLSRGLTLRPRPLTASLQIIRLSVLAHRPLRSFLPFLSSKLHLHGHFGHLIMRDPFPIPAPQWLAEAVRPLADKLSLPTLPMHIHEVLLAVVFYQTINVVIAPSLSRRFFPQVYSSFNKRTRINWDVHIVSMVQSLLVNSVALWIMFYDTERSKMNWAGKIWGYDGASGFLQSLAGGYFMWDLFMCTYHINIFGPGMLAHAISACTVFFFGFVSSSLFLSCICLCSRE